MWSSALRLGLKPLTRHYAQSIDSKGQSLFEKARQGIAKVLQLETRALSSDDQRITRDDLEEIFARASDCGDPIMVQTMQSLSPLIQHRYKRYFINNMLSLHFQTDSMERGLDLFREVQLSNTGKLQVSYLALEQMVLSLLYHKEADLALDAGLALVQLGGSLYTRTWALLLSVFIAKDHYSALLWLRDQNLREKEQPIFTDFALQQLARIGAQNGDYNLARWAFLKESRRLVVLQGEAISLQPNRLTKGYINIIEACANECSDPARKPTSGSIRHACKFILALSHQAAHVRVRDFKDLINALHDETKFAYFMDIYNSLKLDPLANESVRTLYFNLVIAAHVRHVGAAADSEWLLNARLLYDESLQLGISHNEDSYFQLVKLGLLLKSSHFIDNLLELAPKPLSRRLMVAAFLSYRELGNEGSRNRMLQMMNERNYTAFNDFDNESKLSLCT